jgi:hypothetical protein
MEALDSLRMRAHDGGVMQLDFLIDSAIPDVGKWWPVIIMAILTIVYAVFRPLLKKKDPLKKPPSFASLSQQRAVEREMQNVLVELSEMARQISAQLDTRAGKLEALIKEADEKIALLKIGTSASSSSLNVDINRPAPPAPVDPRHREIYEMADQGRSSREIAQHLNRPSGEIELILALRQ